MEGEVARGVVWKSCRVVGAVGLNSHSLSTQGKNVNNGICQLFRTRRVPIVPHTFGRDLGIRKKFFFHM